MPAVGRVCGRDAGPGWCTEPVHCRGMCRRHYRRAARGLPVDPDHGHQVGITPSGHGLWGVVTIDDTRLVCHDCGRRYIALAVHIGMAHGSVRDYRMRHGLLMSTPLTATELSARLADAARSNGGVQRIAVARDPDAARRAADPTLIYRGLRLRRRRH